MEKEIRCSRLPLALACPASQVPPAVTVERDDAAARLGSAVHLLMAQAVLGRPVEAAEAAARHRVEDVDELERLAAAGWACWEQLRDFFVAPRVEEEMIFRDPAGWRLTGHADLLSVVVADGGRIEVRLGDWKSGWADGDHADQLRGYCVLALGRTPEADTARAVTVHLRERFADSVAYSRAELETWWGQAREQLARQDTYRPGRHCRYCPRGHECPAKTELLRQAAVSIEEKAPGFALPEGLPERGAFLAGLLGQIRLLDQVGECLRELIAADVALHGGRLPAGAGQELALVEQTQRRIDYARGLPVLQRRLTPEQLARCVNVVKGKVEDAVKETVDPTGPRGGKARAVRRLIEELEQADAFVPSTILRLEVRRVPTAGAVTVDPGHPPQSRELPGATRPELGD